MRKIIDEEHPPVEAYLIMQKEAAERFTGAGKTTQVSVLAKPWFKLRIIRHFKRTDFCPMPKADVVMLHIEKTKHPLISPSQKSMYERFVKYGFAAWKKNLRSTYKKTFTNNQWKRLAHDLEFPVRAKPSELRFSQWLGLFEFLIIHKYQQSTDKKSNNPDPLTGSTARS
jgi:23S rRNA (adenine-N6)-dimethyltransferase